MLSCPDRLDGVEHATVSMFKPCRPFGPVLVTHVVHSCPNMFEFEASSGYNPDIIVRVIGV